MHSWPPHVRCASTTGKTSPYSRKSLPSFGRARTTETMTAQARKKSPTEPAPEYTWQGFIAYAESFGQAAMHVSNGIRMPHNAPVGALACHCIELSLKAVLLSRGYTAERVIAFGHNLN